MFGGNQAGVCPLAEWLRDERMQEIAAENNLAETAFFVPRGAGEYNLRWFSPEMEIDPCGHATLASAHVLWHHRGEIHDTLTFHTQSGPLTVTRDGDRLALNFPAWPAHPRQPPGDVLDGLGAVPLFSGLARDWLFVLRSEEEVRELRPDFARLTAWDGFGVIVTAASREADFVSRFFAPHAGIAEDPATGSSHCTLVPYWSKELGKCKLHARQVSRRGGEFFCRMLGDRVEIAGHAVTYLTAAIEG